MPDAHLAVPPSGRRAIVHDEPLRSDRVETMSNTSSRTNSHSLEWHLDQPYPYLVMPDPAGGYVIRFPDLPGCMTQVESADEIAPMADEIRTLWIETEFERGEDIPLPLVASAYSGKFIVRIPRSLHRNLAEMAERESVSLNALVTTLLARAVGQRDGDDLAARLPPRPRGRQPKRATLPDAAS